MSEPLLNNNVNLFQRIKRFADEGLITLCLLFTFILIVLIIFSFPISQIVIGSLFQNQCPMNYLIPIHLIVTGVVTLTLLIICILQILLEKSSFLSFLRIVFQMSCLGWLITGSIWTFRAREIVQYYIPDNRNTYCHPLLFRYAFVTLFISYGLLVGTVCSTKKHSK